MHSTDFLWESVSTAWQLLDLYLVRLHKKQPKTRNFFLVCLFCVVVSLRSCMRNGCLSLSLIIDQSTADIVVMINQLKYFSHVTCLSVCWQLEAQAIKYF